MPTIKAAKMIKKAFAAYMLATRHKPRIDRIDYELIKRHNQYTQSTQYQREKRRRLDEENKILAKLSPRQKRRRLNKGVIWL